MNVLSWSREYFRKHSPPIFTRPLGCQGYLMWLSCKRGSCRLAVLGMPTSLWANLPRHMAQGEISPAFLFHPGADFTSPLPPQLLYVLFHVLCFSIGVEIILILFCLHNVDCYRVTNYSHIFIQTANGRDKAAVGLYDFCLSNYSNYLKNGKEKWIQLLACSKSLMLYAADKLALGKMTIGSHWQQDGYKAERPLAVMCIAESKSRGIFSMAVKWSFSQFRLFCLFSDTNCHRDCCSGNLNFSLPLHIYPQ